MSREVSEVLWKKLNQTIDGIHDLIFWYPLDERRFLYSESLRPLAEFVDRAKNCLREIDTEKQIPETNTTIKKAMIGFFLLAAGASIYYCYPKIKQALQSHTQTQDDSSIARDEDAEFFRSFSR